MHCYIGMELSNSFYTFIRQHAADDTVSLRLKYSGNTDKRFDFPLDFALMQIEARKKTRKKLSDFISNERFLFPSIIAAEQASNQTVARFHASLLSNCTNILDLTAGLGIDDISFARNRIQITACEIEDLKCEVLRHNAAEMKVDDFLTVVNTDSIEFLRSCSFRFDAVFADPARRDSAGAKVHALADCQPDILTALPDILRVSNRLIVKSSPLLDISLVRETVPDLYHIHIVCFKGECKEVLVDVRKDAPFTGVTVVDLDTDSMISTFKTDFSPISNRDSIKYTSRNSPIDYAWLYEPNAGVMKTGDWSALQLQFPDLDKADVNTHLFLSDTFYSDFPGRVTRIDCSIDKKSLKLIKKEKINVVSRNHPLSAPMIYKKYSIVPGSDSFIYAFRFNGFPMMIKTRSK